MSYLDTVTTGRQQDGLRAVIYGLEKSGKTTLVAGMPNCILLPLESGTTSIETAKGELIDSYDELIYILDEFIAAADNGAFPYDSVAIDSASTLERLCREKCFALDAYENRNNSKYEPESQTIESILGGYAKAYDKILSMFSEVLGRCDTLALKCAKRVNVAFTAHAAAVKMNDPLVGEYQAWEMLMFAQKMGTKSGPRNVLSQWADLLGFLHTSIVTRALAKDIKGNEKGVRLATSDDKVVLSVSRDARYAAGNRYELEADIKIPKPPACGWNAVALAIQQSKGYDYLNHDKE